MNITFEQKIYGAILRVTADNVDIQEDISKTIYGKKEDGSVDFSKRLGKELDVKVLNSLVSVLEDMIGYSDSEYDSSRLIEYLFEKLPQDKLSELMIKLNKDYNENTGTPK